MKGLPDSIQPARLLDLGDDGCTAVADIAADVGRLDPGQVLEVQTTDPTLEADLPVWSRLAGHEYLGCTREQRVWRLWLRRGPRA